MDDTKTFSEFALTAAVLLFLSGNLASAVELLSKGPDKSKYNIFHPTPRDQMREFSTDRPDKTESPFTVDAGHFQVEADIAIYAKDKSEITDPETGAVRKVDASALGLAVVNLKAGLTNWIDFQVVFASFTRQVVNIEGDRTQKTGVGDVVLRTKFNLLGNDSGPIAFGLMPLVKIPTNTNALGNNKIEGGIILPVALALPEEWAAGVMFQVNKIQNESDEKYHTDFITSFTLGRPISGELSGYVEFFSLVSNEKDARWIATADAGLTYLLIPDVQLDAGVNVGLTEAADDINPFVGISARF